MPAPEKSKKSKKPKRKLSEEEKKHNQLRKERKNAQRDFDRVDRLKMEKIAERNKLKEEIKNYKNQAQKLKDNLAKIDEKMKQMGVAKSKEEL